MYAVIKAGGKQYIVNEGMKLKVEKLSGEIGEKVKLDEVLLIGGNGPVRIGAPLVSGATVHAEIIRQAKDKKIIVYKKKRRRGFEKRQGHRQLFTEIKVTKIEA